MKVLIAEDSAIARLMLRRVVEKLGHNCLEAKDGEEAWALFQDRGAEVIVSDWVMPGMEGPELCRRIRADARGGYTYFIMLTMLESKQHALQGMTAGADDYLVKPLDPADLQARLIAAERVTALHRELAQSRAEMQRMNEELYRTARTDPLTGLGNRLRLQEDLYVLHGRVERYGHCYCVALCDIDRFKAYNDLYGHLAGDQVLRKVGETIAQLSRRGDAAYRYGGEEFLVVWPEQSPATAFVAAERLRKAIQNLALPHERNAPTGVVTLSAGVASFCPGQSSPPEELVKRADAALYQAKEAGRNRVVGDAAMIPEPAA